ncbi:DNA alkylation repair protein [Mucilaginibacter auburnensis]|uniref:3-methyladenine DNA glycosylase AlkD n=1 Tax=Mucilaginibacter auburnensis TaxID=1457233 RepID=A0A2H9VNV9_9SPHI|nr:DNA alkylation repair protein [Mucilaginibacter auburnensis]PJJ80039.1 3-methyladenine DNA glycosylase AlkD [Mucilaginibacter auburnensis]
MTATEVLGKLEALGDEKVRVQNAKRGASPNQFGVKMGDIRAVAKALKTNHKLALELWATGNVEARLVAILVMVPKELSVDELDTMVRSERFPWAADWLSSYVIKEHPEKEQLRIRWMQSDDPMTARAGWSLTASKIARDAAGLDLPALLDRIETEMPTAAPEVQWTMNTALAYIGIHHPPLRERALAIGERLGIFRDYPVSKGCTSPFAPIWINEMVKRGSK